MASPLCEVRDGSGPWQSTVNGVDVTPGGTVYVRPVSLTGIDTWELDPVGTDETTADTDIVITNDPVTMVASFTMPATRGKTVILRSRINGAINRQRVYDPTLEATIGIFTRTADGLRVLATNETAETDATYGWVKDVNAGIRNVSVGGGGGGGGGGGAGTNTFTASTTGAETKTAFSIDISALPDGIYDYTVVTQAIVSDGSDGAPIQRRRAFRVVSGVIAESYAERDDYTGGTAGSPLAANAHLVSASTKILVQVAGVAAKTIAWTGTVFASGNRGPIGPAGSTGSATPAGWVDVTGSPYLAVGDGTTDNSAALSAVAAAANKTVLFPPGTYYVNGNVTFPSTQRLVFVPGAKLLIASGKTVTVNGPIDAGRTQEIFDHTSAGTAAVGAGQVYSDGWWGTALTNVVGTYAWKLKTSSGYGVLLFDDPDNGRQSVTTTDGTANVTCATYHVATGETKVITSTIVATQTAGTGSPDSYFEQRRIVVRNDAGTLTVLKADTQLDVTANSAGTAWSSNLTTSGATVIHRVTGDAGKTIKWGTAGASFGVS